MSAFLTAETAEDVACILRHLNAMDHELAALSSKRDEDWRVELGFTIDLVDAHGDNIGWVYNEVGPGCWSFTDKDPRPADMRG